MENKCLTGCKKFHGGEIQHFKDCPYYEGSLSQMYDQLQENCRLIYENLELQIQSKYEYTAWVAFNSNDRKTLPKKHGKYLICRKDGKIHWETWNGSGWAYNQNQIAYWAVIVPPDKKT
jgi:hypothetical protein